MNPRLVQAFNNVGVADPVPYVQDTLDRLDKIVEALAEEQKLAGSTPSAADDQSISQAKRLLHSILV
jgi:hypothetical protein